MAAEGFAPLNLGRIHVVHGSPHVAGMVQTLATLVMVAFAALGGVDPFAGLFAWAGTFASLGVLTIQILTSFAVFQFFRCKPGTTSFLKGTVAPLAAALGLTACLALAIVNLPLIAGSASHFVFLLPAGIILAALAGWAAGLVLPHPANTEKLLVPAIAESER
jgi:amino acid transporter